MTNVNFRVEFLLCTACGCFSHDAGGSSRIARTHYVQWIQTMVGKPKEFDCRFYRSSNFGEGTRSNGPKTLVQSIRTLERLSSYKDSRGYQSQKNQRTQNSKPKTVIADYIIGYNFKAETELKRPKTPKNM